MAAHILESRPAIEAKRNMRLARKKNTPSKTGATDAKAGSSKAGAISGVVKDAEFDELDAAMADTKVEGVTLGGPEDASEDGVAQDVEVDKASNESEPEDVPEAEIVEDMPEDKGDEKPEARPEAEPVITAPIVPTPPTVVERRGGFWATLMGGALAAVIGFGGAIYFKAAEWPIFNDGADVDAMFVEQAKTIAALQAALDVAQTNSVTADEALGARIDALPTQSAAPLPDDVQAMLDAQRAEMEALEANLEKMRSLTQDQIATAQAQQESAAEAEARVKARGALNALRSALETGAPYASVIPDIAAATDVPDVLSANAETGIPTAAAVEGQFADGARAALSASLKATAGDSTTERLTFFLKDQLGARSLTPRDGDDPDAVLSRAEAATKAGDLDTALTTIDALPEAGRAKLDDWAGVAATRRDALAAFEGLTDALNAN